jgi:hypothetical protein
MNKTLTLEIDEQLLDRARRRAVDENKSVPAWVAELLRRTLDEAEEYEQHRRRALQRLDTGFHLGGQPLTREDLYDRG